MVKRGQIITGRKTLHEKTGISEQTIRTCLKRLENTKEITIKSTNQFSVITICKYNDYQPKEKQTNQQLTSDQPATNQQLTTIKEVKNNKKEREEQLTARALIFKDLIRQNKKDYSVEMLTAFYEYWIEPNSAKTKMRFETEKFFDVSRRLSTWSSREQVFAKKD